MDGMDTEKTEDGANLDSTISGEAKIQNEKNNAKERQNQKEIETHSEGAGLHEPLVDKNTAEQEVTKSIFKTDEKHGYSTFHDEGNFNIPESSDTDGCLPYIPRRYIVSVVTGLGMLLLYVMRTNVGVIAITLLDAGTPSKVGSIEAVINLPDVKWTTMEVGLLHAIFYVGYFISHLPGGYFTTVWPSHRMYGGCILMSAVLNLLLPYTIEYLHYSVPCVIRFFQGLSEGLMYPACYGVLRHWSTSQERGRVVTAVITASYAGAIVGFPLGGLITHYIGWQYVFYVCSGALIVWYILWLCVVYEKPSHCLSISDDEFHMLTKSQGHSSVEYENLKTPWKAILTSLPVISLCLCHFARYWIFILMLTNEPYYLNLFGFTIKETGFYSALPHAMKVLMALLSGYVSDIILVKEYASTTMVRKLLTTVGFGGQAVCFFLLTFVQTGTLAIVLLIFGLGFFGISVPGWQINHYDLSARYAGVLVSITSAFGTLAAIIVPLVVGELTFKQDLAGWDNVFYVSCVVSAIPSIFYFFLGSGTEQPWAHPPSDVELIQKVDPLAKKPYLIQRLQKPEMSYKPIDEPTSDSKTQLLHRTFRKSIVTTQ